MGAMLLAPWEQPAGRKRGQEGGEVGAQCCERRALTLHALGHNGSSPPPPPSWEQPAEEWGAGRGRGGGTVL